LTLPDCPEFFEKNPIPQLSHMPFFISGPWGLPGEMNGTGDVEKTSMGLLKKAASGVLAIFPCSRTKRMLRA
jgi:hypothetical protein